MCKIAPTLLVGVFLCEILGENRLVGLCFWLIYGKLKGKMFILWASYSLWLDIARISHKLLLNSSKNAVFSEKRKSIYDKSCWCSL